MGVEQALSASMAVQAGSSAFSGISGLLAGEEQAELYGEQAKLAQQEAQKEASRLRAQFKIDNARMRLQFFKQGVATSGGSVANITRSNLNLQDEEARAVIAAGAAQADVLNARGQAAKATGRAKLVGSVFSGALGIASMYAKGKELGYFSKPIDPNTLKPGATDINRFRTNQYGQVNA